MALVPHGDEKKKLKKAAGARLAGEGGRWVRLYGILGEGVGTEYVMDFGPGGEMAAQLALAPRRD